jgi:CRISPR/Cas system type I-B associated protein Csh2 (Cas7 group RAMP superfamily)
MQFMEPKKRLEKKVDWKISGHTQSIVEYYAEFTGYTEDEVVDQFLKNLLDDKKFIEWANNKRRNKRVFQKLFPKEVELNGKD